MDSYWSEFVRLFLGIQKGVIRQKKPINAKRNGSSKLCSFLSTPKTNTSSTERLVCCVFITSSAVKNSVVIRSHVYQRQTARCSESPVAFLQQNVPGKGTSPHSKNSHVAFFEHTSCVFCAYGVRERTKPMVPFCSSVVRRDRPRAKAAATKKATETTMQIFLKVLFMLFWILENVNFWKVWNFVFFSGKISRREENSRN